MKFCQNECVHHLQLHLMNKNSKNHQINELIHKLYTVGTEISPRFQICIQNCKTSCEFDRSKQKSDVKIEHKYARSDLVMRFYEKLIIESCSLWNSASNDVFICLKQLRFMILPFLCSWVHFENHQINELIHKLYTVGTGISPWFQIYMYSKLQNKLWIW